MTTPCPEDITEMSVSALPLLYWHFFGHFWLHTKPFCHLKKKKEFREEESAFFFLNYVKSK